jgi:hypothetical protein
MIKKSNKFRPQKSFKSARTSFKLNAKTADEIENIANNMGKTYKDIFEEMCSDDRINTIKDNLNEINKLKIQKNSVRKSYVIAEDILFKLNTYSKRLKVSRDILIEFLFAAEKKRLSEKKSKVKGVYKDVITPCHKRIIETQKKLENNLDYEDDYAIIDIHECIVEFYKNFKLSLKMYLDKGIEIDIPPSVPLAIEDYKLYLEGK